MIIAAAPTPCVVPMELDVGQDVGINAEDFLGVTAFGRVYGCTYQGQRAAIKILHPSMIAPEPMPQLAALRREVEIVAHCPHPNIVRILGANLTPPNIFLLEERLPTHLRDAIYNDNEEMGLVRVLSIACDIAAGE